MQSDGKVLTGLLERRRRETAFKELAHIDNLDELVLQATRIAEDGADAIPALLAMLDTDDPQLRGGLGQVAVRLPRELVAPALQGVVRSAESSDHARISALTILDRFLNIPVDDSLLASLQDPDLVAQQSLAELRREMARDQFVVIDYLEQLAKQPPEVTGMILDAAALAAPDPYLVTLLRMLAQDEDPFVARRALDQLSRVLLPEAVDALSTLAETLAPDRAALARRGVRKLQMRGISRPFRPEPDLHWQTLASLVDGSGAQLIWFVDRQNGEQDNLLFSVVTRDPVGIIASFSTREAIGFELPPLAEIGRICVVSPGEDAPSIIMLTIPFAEARQAIREALCRNWESGYPTPASYRLLNPLIWGATAPQDATADATSAAENLDSTPDEPALDPLLDHPFFESWRYGAAEQVQVWLASDLKHHAGLADRETAISLLVKRIFDPETTASYQRRLTAMGRWFDRASDQASATLARIAARQLTQHLPVEAEFARQLVGRGLGILEAQGVLLL